METSPEAMNPELLHEPAALRAMKEITYGSIAGMISKVIEHPFDLTKVRLQSQVLDSNARFAGPIDCLKKTFKNEGFKGLYRGLPAPIVGAMAENASLFLSYGEFQNLIHHIIHRPSEEKLSLSYLALAAAGAGAVTSFILTPIELVKCKMQVQMLIPASNRIGPLPGPISVLTSVVRATGLRGLWLGHTGTLIRETGGTAAWFSTKEYIASLLVVHRLRKQGHHHRNHSNSPNDDDDDTDVLSVTSAKNSATELLPWESAVSGACAGAAFNIALFPADTVKSAMQTEEELRPRAKKVLRPGEKPSPKATFLGTFLAMYRAQGIRGLYAGCGVTVARSIPSSAVIFLTYDGLKKYFG